MMHDKYCSDEELSGFKPGMYKSTIQRLLHKKTNNCPHFFLPLTNNCPHFFCHYKNNNKNRRERQNSLILKVKKRMQRSDSIQI